MRISVDSEKCTGCRICELACSQTKLQSFNPKNACVKVVNLDYWGFSNPVLCVQCKHPACVEICSPGALSQTEDGIILLDKEKCDACGLCIDSCFIGAINWNEERGLPMICDLCGGKPVCVEWCPINVLTFDDSSAKRIKSKGRGGKELKYSVGKGKRSLSKLKVTADVSGWYDKFIQE